MEILKNGGQVLVVGGRGANFPAPLRENPRLVFWDSTEESLKRDIPANVKAIVMTRFVSHALSGKLIGTARKRRITIFNGQGTGEIKRVLEQLVGGKEVELPKLPTVTQYVKEHADLTKSPTEEAKRVLEEMEKVGISSTEGSVMVAITKLRRKAGLGRSYKRKVQPEQRAYITSLPISKGDDKGEKPTATVDGAFTILQEGITALQLALEGFRTLVEENQKLHERLERIRGAF